MTPTPEPPAIAGEIFGERLELVVRYAGLLTGPGIDRGLLGPREAPRLWERHLLNCAVLTRLLPPEARIVDIGSGAGLPGLVIAIQRPDIQVDLVEPLLRRSVFLREAVAELGLADQVRVFRGRAEEASLRAEVGLSQWVTARAVAPLDRLGSWCLPLLSAGGYLLAMKGESAGEEAAEHAAALRRLGAGKVEVMSLDDGVGGVVRVVVVARGGKPRAAALSRRSQ